METIGDLILVGGGGGFELSNQISVFKFPAKLSGTPVLDKPIFELKTDKSVANFMRKAREVSNDIVLSAGRALHRSSQFVSMRTWLYTRSI
jgi:hypothetical protein